MVGEKLPSVVGDCGKILEFQWERKLEEVGQKRESILGRNLTKEVKHRSIM